MRYEYKVALILHSHAPVALGDVSGTTISESIMRITSLTKHEAYSILVARREEELHSQGSIAGF